MNLKIAELELQKKRINLGIDEMDYKILQLEDEKQRILKSKEISLNRIKELDELISKLKLGE